MTGPGSTAVRATAASPPSGGAFDQWVGARAARTEAALSALLPPEDELPDGLHRAMRYAVLGGGKRVRPLLVHAAGELVGAPAQALDHAACAVELIHAYSLVHDDLPCMDDDVLRRGKPTVHVAFGEATAMLAGDALQTLAFEALARAIRVDVPAGAVVEMVGLLAVASGSRGMAGGQAIDLASVGERLDRSRLETMHRRKTGALLGAAVMMGAACANPADQAFLPVAKQALARYAEAMGLAFQVVDDVLDVEADAATLGKTAGKDALAGKPTYVSVLGLAESKTLAMSLRADAQRALDPFGQAADRLRELADLIVLRRS